jgi:DNA-binding transcriptional MerR regulator
MRSNLHTVTEGGSVLLPAYGSVQGPGGVLYRSRDVARILGITRRRLQYWAKSDLVPPSASTRGGHHRYTFQDLVALKAAKRLVDAGVSIQRIRRSIQSLRRTLPNVRRPLVELVLVATGDVVLVLHRGTAFEAVSGQEWVFDVAQLQHEVDSWRSSEAAAPSSEGTGRSAGPSHRSV